jgi:2-hydroxycyclohexanecarboxyl-CoA dehydrogenase
MPDAQPRPFRIDEARVLISGGTSGVGLATAKKFAALGAPQIVINGRNPERGAAAAEAVRQVGGLSEVHFVAANSAEKDGARALVNAAEAAMGGVDVLVNATTSAYPFPNLFHTLDVDDMEGMVLSQLMSFLYLSRMVLDGMRERRQGAIINIASDAAKVATPGEALIGGVMAAIVMFSRGLALEAKRSNIRVNTVTPSIIEGTATHDTVMQGEFASKIFSKAKQLANLGVVNADDMAELITFLASPAAAKLSGQAISLNGGISVA